MECRFFDWYDCLLDKFNFFKSILLLHYLADNEIMSTFLSTPFILPKSKKLTNNCILSCDNYVIFTNYKRWSVSINILYQHNMNICVYLPVFLYHRWHNNLYFGHCNQSFFLFSKWVFFYFFYKLILNFFSLITSPQFSVFFDIDSFLCKII